MKQLTIEDVIGSCDYQAKSTVEKFLAKSQRIPTYAVDFFDKNKRQVLDWFEANNELEAEGAAKGRHGYEIQIVRIYVSDRSLQEIMELD